MQYKDRIDGRYFEKDGVYRIGSRLFSIKREYCLNRKLEDIIGDIILKKEFTAK